MHISALVPRAFKMDQAVLKGILSSLISDDFVKADWILPEINKILIRGFTFYVKFTVHSSSRWYRTDVSVSQVSKRHLDLVI